MLYVNGLDLDFANAPGKLPEIFLFDTVLDTTVPKTFSSLENLLTHVPKARACVGHDGNTTIVAGRRSGAQFFTNLKFAAPDQQYTYRDLLLAKSGLTVGYEDYTIGENDNRMSWIIPEWSYKFTTGYNGGEGYIGFFIRSQIANNTLGCRPSYTATVCNPNSQTAKTFGTIMSFGTTQSQIGSISTTWDCRVDYADMPVSARTAPCILTIQSFSRSGGLIDPPDRKGTQHRAHLDISSISLSVDSVKPNIMAIPIGENVLTLTENEFNVNSGNYCLPGNRYPISINMTVKPFNLGL